MTASQTAPTRVTRIAEEGSLLGLPATVQRKPYSLTVEATSPAEVRVVSGKQFRKLLSMNTALGMNIVTMLADGGDIAARCGAPRVKREVWMLSGQQ